MLVFEETWRLDSIKRGTWFDKFKNHSSTCCKNASNFSNTDPSSFDAVSDVVILIRRSERDCAKVNAFIHKRTETLFHTSLWSVSRREERGRTEEGLSPNANVYSCLSMLQPSCGDHDAHRRFYLMH